MMRYLHVDFETRSSVDLKTAGVKKYTESPDFQIILVAWARDDEPVNCCSPDNMPYLDELLLMFSDPEIIKVAHNGVSFERSCILAQWGVNSPSEQWIDTMILASYAGLPASLDGCGEALNLTEKKLKSGVSLINWFCKPCKPGPKNHYTGWHSPEESPAKWDEFKTYCARDVVTEREIFNELKDLETPAWERKVFDLDTRINARGVLLDKQFIESALYIDQLTQSKLYGEMVELTGLNNPMSVTQLNQWLHDRDCPLASLAKDHIQTVLALSTLPSDVRRVLELRLLLSKTSIKKYDAMLAGECADGRVHGITQYYGTRTGRWAGRKVQLQNLPQNHLDPIEGYREIIKNRDIKSLELIGLSEVPDILSQLIRTAFIAPPGETLLVADFSAIEARVIAYLAGENWVLDAFRSGKDIYCETASKMFHVPVEKHGVNAHLRAKGKICTLALGYQGGVGALKAFGADKMGMTEAEMQALVYQWRDANPHIVRFWKNVERAATLALRGYPAQVEDCSATITMQLVKGRLEVKLPSGRIIRYVDPVLDGNRISYWGQDQTTRRWTLIDTYGGKLVENIVQAVARDILAQAMLKLDAAGYKIVFHVHDEVICEAPADASWKTMAAIMASSVPWAPGLPLNADGYSTEFYKKD